MASQRPQVNMVTWCIWWWVATGDVVGGDSWWWVVKVLLVVNVVVEWVVNVVGDGGECSR